MLQAAQFAAHSINFRGVQVQVSSLSLASHVSAGELGFQHEPHHQPESPATECVVFRHGSEEDLQSDGKWLFSALPAGLFHTGSGGKEKVFKTKSAGDIIQCNHKLIPLSSGSALSRERLHAWWQHELSHMSKSCWQTLWLHFPAFHCALQDVQSAGMLWCCLWKNYLSMEKLGQSIEVRYIQQRQSAAPMWNEK